MKNDALKKSSFYLFFILPLLGFSVGMLVGWLAYVNELTAWIIAVPLLILIPVLAVFAFICLASSPFFEKKYRPFMWIFSLAILCFLAGIEISSGITLKCFTLWYDIFETTDA